jgi:hypothetical protein
MQTEYIEAGTCDFKLRQDLKRIVVHKLIATFGHYPSKEVPMRVASVLGEIIGLQRHLFYDDVTHEGFLQCGLQNARRRLPVRKNSSGAIFSACVLLCFALLTIQNSTEIVLFSCLRPIHQLIFKSYFRAPCRCKINLIDKYT